MSPWFFKDRAGAIQGPFSDDEMRAWYEAGYLAADLMISKDRMQWSQLAKWFPNGAVAFLPAEQARVVQPQQAQAQGGQWYFVDKNFKVQGPFSDIHMRQWHMARYFEPTLQIMNTSIPNAQWQLLRDVFPVFDDAFLSTPQSGANKGGAAATAAANKPQQPVDIKARFEFPGWLPVPPKYRGVKKTYPSEKNSGARRQRVNITDVNGQQVSQFAHARARAPT